MSVKNIHALLKEGEGLRTEFKACKNAVPRNVYETVCSFLNRYGGEILLGVSDNGEVTGIEPSSIERVKNDFITSVNNPKKISPAVYIAVEEAEIEGKLLLYINVPQSSQVHSCNGKIFDRNQDGDFDITSNHHLVANLYINKQSVFTENKVFPYCEPADLRPELIDKARRMASFQRTNHPWKSLDDRELLNSARVYLHDYTSGKEGITMAGILLFGKDETILSVLPYHRTDLILRRDNTDRYDDRDFVDTNLIDSYDRIISFGQKHLPDPFYLEGTQRVSIRDKVIREIASNILIHREYSKSYPAKIIIERARIVAENGNRVLSDGIIDPDNFTPNPKNPVLARFFKEIGLADELGSGVRNLFRYSPIFAGSRPVLFEDDVFRVIIPLANMKNSDEYSSTAGQVPGKYRVSTGQAERAGDIRAFCRTPKSSKEIMTHLGLTHRDHFRSEILNPLLEKGLLARTIPEKPNSPKQKYISRL